LRYLLATAFAVGCTTYGPELLVGQAGGGPGSSAGGGPQAGSSGVDAGRGGASGGANTGGGAGKSGSAGSDASGGVSGSKNGGGASGRGGASGGSGGASGSGESGQAGEVGQGGQGGEAPSGSCGNNVIDAGEDCDDGNQLDRDGCSSLCTRWFDAGFTRRTRLDVNNPVGAVQEFPLLVTLDDSSIDWAALGNAGVCLVADDQATLLPTEAEVWNPGSGSLLWVQAPALAASTVTRLWLYYGEPNAANGCAPAGSVWNGDFSGVWHLGNSAESTSHAHATTDSGTTDAAGAVGRGRTVGDGMTLVGPSDPDLHLTGDVTVSAWVSFSKLDSGTYDNSILTYGGTQFVLEENFAYGFYAHPDGSLSSYWAYDDSTTVNVASTTSSLAPGGFHHVALVRDTGAGVVRFYLDGAKLGADVAYAALPNGGDSGHLVLGGNVAGTTYAMTGVLDEVRISSRAVSDDWIALEHAAVMGTLITPVLDP
jgi:cysteine-rich repeat protein